MTTSLRSSLALVVAGLLVAVGLVGWWLAYGLTTSDAAQNLAVVDEESTAQVQSEVAQALTSVLSYDFANPGPTESAADSLLAGQAREDYDMLFTSLQERAPDQEIVLTAQVQSVAVKTLDADSAELLVFLDQSSQRADDQEASVSAAQLAVQAERSDAGWQITGLEPL